MTDADDPTAVGERTLLASRRTALLLGVASVLGARLLAEAVGPWVFAVGLFGVGLALVAHGHASARYRQARILIASGGSLIAATSRRLVAMTAAVFVVGALALVLVAHISPVGEVSLR